jgi:hypothetical protein
MIQIMQVISLPPSVSNNVYRPCPHADFTTNGIGYHDIAQFLSSFSRYLAASKIHRDRLPPSSFDILRSQPQTSYLECNSVVPVLLFQFIHTYSVSDKIVSLHQHPTSPNTDQFLSFNQTSTALTIPNPTTTTFYALNTIRLYLLFNFAYALLPLFPDLFPNLKPKDQVTDIPLTPSQRSLLGLDPSIPSSLPGTPTSGDGKSPFITPPRYRRLSGSSFSGSSPLNAPSTDRRSISATYYSSSPLSASRNFSPSPAPSPFGSPSRGGSGSPFSPSASPLLHKAVGAKPNNNHRDLVDGERRRSFGNSVSGLGRSQSLRERGARAGSDKDKEPDTPSPTGGLAGARRNPHLNYKWLYERGARLPQSEAMLF